MPQLLDNDRLFQTGKSGVGYVLQASKLGGVGGELHQEQVCDSVYGGLAHEGSTVFVPCSNRLRSLTIGDTAFTDNWSVPSRHPGRRRRQRTGMGARRAVGNVARARPHHRH